VTQSVTIVSHCPQSGKDSSREQFSHLMEINLEACRAQKTEITVVLATTDPDEKWFHVPAPWIQ
jgi:hypothetical protein